MSNIIDFPERVFHEWGAIAQELVPYLKSLGASKAEAQKIIDKIKAEWERLGTPAASDSPAVAFNRRFREKTSLVTPPFDIRKTQSGRHWKLESARTLIALAKFEYQASST
jgi:hypothetical protein